MKKGLILYWSRTGNTEKVAYAIKEGLEKSGVDITIRRIEEAENIDFYDHDLICVGSPSYHWHPPKPVTEFLIRIFDSYRRLGMVKLGAPKIPGKNALIFCTYSGPHTGINEVIPVGKYIGQFFDHLGFTVIDEWYILSEFHGSEKNSTMGRMGDVRGKPSEEDLKMVKENVGKIVIKL